ncbi:MULTISPECIES: hypothetical protein [unclassified Endozoicomonas]|uniref:hypothetical protein n=1 Tax=unclassified Endozoicomonas TaxID=2644528 RepID=UPI0021493528|nr:MULTISPECIES: hypothetical protein [unclassified Endozoicomonas]
MQGIAKAALLQPSTKGDSNKESLSIGNFANKSVSLTSLSFTYFPKSQSLISAVKLTEREAIQRDVLTIYYPRGSIYFGSGECQNQLNYDIEDMIFNSDLDHKAELHKPENPTRTNNEEKGWHCHIKVNRKDLPDFLGRVFIRHKVDTTNDATHKSQFLYSMSALRETPSLGGLTFKDGSITQNAECTDMKKSSPLNTDSFRSVEYID